MKTIAEVIVVENQEAVNDSDNLRIVPVRILRLERLLQYKYGGKEKTGEFVTAPLKPVGEKTPREGIAHE